MQGNVSAVQPDSCGSVCFHLVHPLEAEQQFLVCGLGHLAAEVIRPMAMQSLRFETLENLIWKWIWTEECELGQEDEQHFPGWVSLYAWVPRDSNKCSIWEVLYWISLLHAHKSIKDSEKSCAKENSLLFAKVIWPQKTIFFLVITINIAQDTCFPQSRFGEKQDQFVFFFTSRGNYLHL